MKDLSYKAIFIYIAEIVEKRDNEAEKIQAALNDIGIDPHLKMLLIETVYDTYKSQIEVLTKMLKVAEWHQSSKPQPNNSPNATAESGDKVC